MELVNLKLSEIKPREGNPKAHWIEGLKASLEEMGYIEPIVVDEKNVILAGHGRLKILKEMGKKKAKVIVIKGLTEKQKRKYLLLSNKIGERGGWDYELLANFSEEEIFGGGFESEEIDRIFGLDVKEDEFEMDVPEEPKAKLGEVYLLGEHRLMCGDSTKREDVEGLMDGKKADMIFTDPPYNVDYGSSKNPRHKIRNLVGDKQTKNEWEDFNRKWIQNVIDFYGGGDVYVWGASGPEGMKQRLWLNELGFHWSATVIWKKQQLVLSPAKYQRMYEPCYYGWSRKSSYVGGRKQTEVWEINRSLDSKEHPTMKPIELCSRAIKNSSKRDDIVLDLFGGSGSTLIACEQLNRKCYMMELDPKYVDVIINRYEQFTGEKAKKA